MDGRPNRRNKAAFSDFFAGRSVDGTLKEEKTVFLLNERRSCCRGEL